MGATTVGISAQRHCLHLFRFTCSTHSAFFTPVVKEQLVTKTNLIQQAALELSALQEESSLVHYYESDCKEPLQRIVSKLRRSVRTKGQTCVILRAW